jgi:hypothetical protein
MTGRRMIPAIVAFSLMMPGLSWAQTESETDKPGISITGMGALENGQFIKSNYTQSTQQDRPWINRVYGQIRLHSKINDHLSVTIAPEVKLWFDTYPWQTMGNTAFAFPFSQRSTVVLADAQAQLSFGNPDALAVSAMAGVMPFKYNNDAKNLGEYLFRSGARPAYINNSFDFAYSRLNGIRLNATTLSNLSFDCFLTTETQAKPALDWSLSFLANYRLPSLFEAGAGIMFDRLFPVMNSRTQPIGSDNSYLNEAGGVEYWKFGGTKAVAHLMLDPKILLPKSIKEMFGEKDFRIYGEAAVLGIENTTPYKHPLDAGGNPDTNQVVIDSAKLFYEDIKERIPVMFGINVPTLNYLDYLSVELEWYGWQYPNSYGNQGFQILLPTPISVQSGKESLYQVDDNWKYSFNLKRTLYGHLSVIGQVSRDHTQHDIYYPAYEAKNLYEEVFTQKDNWGWWVKLQYTL